MVLEYVWKNQSKLVGMRSIAVEVMDRWVSQSHEYTVETLTEQIQIETASNKHIEIEIFDFRLIF